MAKYAVPIYYYYFHCVLRACALPYGRPSSNGNKGNSKHKYCVFGMVAFFLSPIFISPVAGNRTNAALFPNIMMIIIQAMVPLPLPFTRPSTLLSPWVFRFSSHSVASRLRTQFELGTKERIGARKIGICMRPNLPFAHPRPPARPWLWWWVGGV